MKCSWPTKYFEFYILCRAHMLYLVYVRACYTWYIYVRACLEKIVIGMIGVTSSLLLVTLPHLSSTPSSVKSEPYISEIWTPPKIWTIQGNLNAPVKIEPYKWNQRSAPGMDAPPRPAEKQAILYNDMSTLSLIDLCLLMPIDADWFWLMQIGADWCWLVLIDSDWFRLIPIDTDWFWLMLRQVGAYHFRLTQVAAPKIIPNQSL